MAMESIKDAETNDIPSQFPTLLSPLFRNLNADSVGFSKQCSEHLLWHSWASSRIPGRFSSLEGDSVFGEWVGGYGLPGDGSESWSWVGYGFVWLLDDLSGSQPLVCHLEFSPSFLLLLSVQSHEIRLSRQG